jgi:ubiquinone/menaquinone biosynthesis C-methylase UbiE
MKQFLIGGACMDNYYKLAQYYDDMKVMSDEKLSFFEQIFKSYDNAVILDCACGTGYDLSVFHRLGYTIMGSDISQSMLSVARERPELHGVAINDVSFEELESFYDKQFDCILCLSNAINEIHVNPIKALKSMRNVLKEDGCIIFDQGQTDASMKNPPTANLVVDNQRLSRLMEMKYANDIMTVKITDTIKIPQQELFESVIRINIRLYDDWVSILDQCDLVYNIYGDYMKTPYCKESSTRLIVVAKKK